MVYIVLPNFDIFDGYKQIDNCDQKTESGLEGSTTMKPGAELCCRHQTAATSLPPAKTQLVSSRVNYSRDLRH